MDNHRKFPEMLPIHSQYNISQPGPSSSSVMHGYVHNQLYDDIPDVDADERNFRKPSNPLYRSHLPQGNETSSSLSPTGPTTKILQRSGIKMEIPPYLDPEDNDDDPEEGTVYPDPDLFDVKNTNMTEYDLEVLKLGKQVVDETRKKIETPDASAPPNKIVEYLMFYRTLKESELLQLNAYRTKRNRLSLNLVKNNIDREFDQKACESLVKKLKDKKQDLQNLIDVVISHGEKYTGCITIPRTLDGRLQVHGRKGFPHVVYGKLWRFSEMTKNETRHVDHCKHAFEVKSDLVCVNPYHYELVVGTMIVGQRDSHEGRDLQQINPPTRYQTPNAMIPRQSIDDVHRNSYAPISTPNRGMMTPNMNQNIHQPISSMASCVTPMLPPNIHPSISSNIHSNMNTRIHSTMPQNVHMHPNLHSTMNSTMLSNVNHNITASITPKMELNMYPIVTDSNAQPNRQSNITMSTSQNISSNIHPSLVTENNSFRALPNMDLNTSQDLNFNFQLHNHGNFQQTSSPNMGLAPSYTSGQVPYRADIATPASATFDNNSTVPCPPMNFFDHVNNPYAFQNPPPEHFHHYIEPPAQLGERFVTLAKFRRFCKKRFGELFYSGSHEDFVFPMFAGMTYVEAKETAPLGVEVFRRLLDNGEIHHKPFGSDLPYTDVCKFMFKMTLEEIVTGEDELDTKNVVDQWGTVVYYEGDVFIGEKACMTGNFYVDGGYLSAENRFCIGMESNPERSIDSFKIRKNMIDGIRFSRKSDGSVWIQNYMKWPVFITSGYLDQQAGGYKLDKVHKLYAHAKLKVFGIDVIKEVIRDLLFSKKLASVYLQGGKTMMNSIYQVKPISQVKKEATRTTDSLHKFCCVRVSFCKGFGETYENHSEISKCPVWIELKIKDAYDYMNSILTHFGACFQPEGIEHFAMLGINMSED